MKERPDTSVAVMKLHPHESACLRVCTLFVLFTPGMVLSRELYNQEDLYSRMNGGRPFRDVVVQVTTEQGRTLELTAKRPLTTAVDIPWQGARYISKQLHFRLSHCAASVTHVQ